MKPAVAVFERLDLLNKLQHKHRVTSVLELIDVHKGFTERLDNLQSQDINQPVIDPIPDHVYQPIKGGH